MFEGVSGVKEMWSKLNSITALHKGNFSVEEITEGDRTYRGRALAEKLNNHLTSSVDSVSDTTALHYMSAQTVPLSIYFSSTDEHEVLAVFKKPKKSKSEDIGGLKMAPVCSVIDILVMP